MEVERGKIQYIAGLQHYLVRPRASKLREGIQIWIGPIHLGMPLGRMLLGIQGQVRALLRGTEEVPPCLLYTSDAADE